MKEKETQNNQHKVKKRDYADHQFACAKQVHKMVTNKKIESVNLHGKLSILRHRDYRKFFKCWNHHTRAFTIQYQRSINTRYLQRLRGNTQTDREMTDREIHTQTDNHNPPPTRSGFQSGSIGFLTTYYI